jgi:hypothetical protein
MPGRYQAHRIFSQFFIWFISVTKSNTVLELWGGGGDRKRVNPTWVGNVATPAAPLHNYVRVTEMLFSDSAFHQYPHHPLPAKTDREL